MKKLFISFLTTSVVATFAACGKKTDTQTAPKTETKTETKVETKDETISKTNSSSGSSIVKSPTRNQYIKQSHEQWIANSITLQKQASTLLKPKQEDYKKAFLHWKSTGDGQMAILKAYSKFRDDKITFIYNRWKYAKGSTRTLDEFVNKIAQNKNTASYKIYESWIKSGDGETELNNLKSQTANNDLKNKYFDWNSGAKTPAYYALSDDSDIAFETWINTKKAFDVLNPLYYDKTSLTFTLKYRDWAWNTFHSLPTTSYIQDQKSKTTYDNWRRKPSAQDILKELWYTTDDFSDKVDHWSTQNNISINKEEKYKKSNKHNQDLNIWTENKRLTITPNVKGAFQKSLKIPGSSERKAYTDWIGEKTARNNYRLSAQYKNDIKQWAKRAKKQTNFHFVRDEFIKAIIKDGSIKGELWTKYYEPWVGQSNDKDFYLTKEVRKLNIVKNKIKKIINSSSSKSGNQAFQNAFKVWQPTTKENFMKSSSTNLILNLIPNFHTWRFNLDAFDLEIIFEIEQILKDKNLYTSSKGNSQFVELLKEITKDSYDSYLLSL